MRNFERLFEIIFITTLTVFFFLAILGFVDSNILIKYFNISVLQEARVNNSQPVFKIIEWEKNYPFDDEKKIAEERKENEKSEEKSAFFKKFLAATDKAKKSLEEYSSKKLFGYYRILEWSKIYDLAINFNYVSYSKENGYIRSSDGYYLSFIPPRDFTEQAEQVKSFAQYCRALDIPFLYVNAPAKTCRVQDSDVSGVVDFRNQNVDRLLCHMKSRGVDVYDLSDFILKEGLNHHKLFYRADHHWLPETGRWAAQKIATILNEDYGFNLDVSTLEPDRFSAKVYRQIFLGSQGKRATLTAAELEYLTLLYPTYPTLFHYEIPSTELDVVGDFSVMYNMAELKKNNYYTGNPYITYSYGNQPLERIENKTVGGDRRILIIHDSFGLVTVPFLATTVARVDSIDPRTFTGSIRRFVATERPDVVIVMYVSPADTKSPLFDLR